MNALLCSLLAATSLATNENSFVERLHLDAYADFETAYKQRGFVIDKHPIFVQSVEPLVDLGMFGFVGFDVWAVSATSRTGQSYNRRNAYNEVYYDVLYGYEYSFVEDWKLSTWVWLGWDTLPGYREDSQGFSEWCIEQSLENPYVSPYWHLERCVKGGDGSYWEVGLRRRFNLTDQLKLTVSFFSELCNGRHISSTYGANPFSGDGTYSSGFMALDLDIRLAYYLTEWMNIYAFVHQFDAVSSDLRDINEAARRYYGYVEALSDITYGGVGIQIEF